MTLGGHAQTSASAARRVARRFLGRVRDQSQRSSWHWRTYLAPVFTHGSTSGRDRLVRWFARLHMAIVLCVAVDQLGSQGLQVSRWLSGPSEQQAAPRTRSLVPLRRVARPSAGAAPRGAALTHAELNRHCVCQPEAPKLHPAGVGQDLDAGRGCSPQRRCVGRVNGAGGDDPARVAAAAAEQ